METKMKQPWYKSGAVIMAIGLILAGIAGVAMKSASAKEGMKGETPTISTTQDQGQSSAVHTNAQNGVDLESLGREMAANCIVIGPEIKANQPVFSLAFQDNTGCRNFMTANASNMLKAGAYVDTSKPNVITIATLDAAKPLPRQFYGVG